MACKITRANLVPVLRPIVEIEITDHIIDGNRFIVDTDIGNGDHCRFISEQGKNTAIIAVSKRDAKKLGDALIEWATRD